MRHIPLRDLLEFPIKPVVVRIKPVVVQRRLSWKGGVAAIDRMRRSGVLVLRAVGLGAWRRLKGAGGRARVWFASHTWPKVAIVELVTGPLLWYALSGVAVAKVLFGVWVLVFMVMVAYVVSTPVLQIQAERVAAIVPPVEAGTVDKGDTLEPEVSIDPPTPGDGAKADGGEG